LDSLPIPLVDSYLLVRNWKTVPPGVAILALKPLQQTSTLATPKYIPTAILLIYPLNWSKNSKMRMKIYCALAGKIWYIVSKIILQW